MRCPISVEHAERAGELPGGHRDRFDRMLIVQARAETCFSSAMSASSTDMAFSASGKRGRPKPTRKSYRSASRVRRLREKS
jgi:PIN domain nuclease of toxin-antitoxin system